MGKKFKHLIILKLKNKLPLQNPIFLKDVHIQKV